jgi:hypothetical protein
MGSATLGVALLPIVLGSIMRVGSTEWLGSLLAGLAVVLLAVLFVRERLVLRPGGEPSLPTQ